MYLRGLAQNDEWGDWGDEESGGSTESGGDTDWMGVFKTVVKTGTDAYKSHQQREAAEAAAQAAQQPTYTQLPRPVVPYPGYSPFPVAAQSGAGIQTTILAVSAAAALAYLAFK